MALVKCPECGREKVSSTAIACPDCGFNVKEYYENIEIKNSKVSTNKVTDKDEVKQKLKNIDDQKEEALNRNKVSYEHKLEEVEKAEETYFSTKYLINVAIFGAIVVLLGVFMIIKSQLLVGLFFCLFGAVPIFCALSGYMSYKKFKNNPEEWKESKKDELKKQFNDENKHTEKSYENQKLEELQRHCDNDDTLRCPNCGSTNVVIGQRGFSAMTGFIGSSQTLNRCGKCGYKWKPKG